MRKCWKKYQGNEFEFEFGNAGNRPVQDITLIILYRGWKLAHICDHTLLVPFINGLSCERVVGP